MVNASWIEWKPVTRHCLKFACFISAHCFTYNSEMCYHKGVQETACCVMLCFTSPCINVISNDYSADQILRQRSYQNHFGPISSVAFKVSAVGPRFAWMWSCLSLVRLVCCFVGMGRKKQCQTAGESGAGQHGCQWHAQALPKTLPQHSSAG